MGINKNTLRFLLLSKKNGADFSQTAMIGRQVFTMPENHFLEVMKEESGIEASDEKLVEIYRHVYAEKLFTLLGAQTVHSFDYSDYEKASFVHDFNAPIPDKFKGQYSLVIDGGSLEHIFNFPVAIANCMEMVKASGHFITVTPANNNFGHGFYQFSPELFYRVLSTENGYQVKNMFYYDSKFSRQWMSIADPAVIGKRSLLVNSQPVMICLLSQRTAIKKLFAQTPQQSDYQAAWESQPGGKKTRRSSLSKLKSMVPISVKTWFRLKNPLKPDPAFFKKVDIVEVLRNG